MWGLGFILAYEIVSRLFKKEGYPDNWADKLFVYCIVSSVVGARLGHCLFYDFDYYSAHPWQILNLRQGGLASHGAALGMPGLLAPVADYGTLSKAVEAAKALHVNAKVGPVYTSDHFYYPTDVLNTKARELGHLCIEMETAGLYWTAAACHKKALSILTVSDHLYTGEALSAADRQESFHEMMEVALETAWQCVD